MSEDNVTRKTRRSIDKRLEKFQSNFKVDFCVAFQRVVNELNNKIKVVLSKELDRKFVMNLELLREYGFCAPVKTNKLRPRLGQDKKKMFLVRISVKRARGCFFFCYFQLFYYFQLNAFFTHYYPPLGTSSSS